MARRRKSQRAPAPVLDRLLAVAATALLIAALIFGGATQEGYLAHGLLRIASLPVLLLALWRLSLLSLSRPAAQGLMLLAAAAAVAFAQLIPLPPAVWSALPGRQAFVEAYRVAGMPLPWLPLSLASEETWNAALSLLPPAALFVATLALDGRARRRMVSATLTIAVLSVVLGVLQVGGSAPRPYDITNPSSAVGLFANRNHQAALLLASIPLTAQWMVSGARSAPARRPLIYGAGFGVTAVFVVGLLASGSRAGMALSVPALAASVLIVTRLDLARLSRRTIGVVALAVAAAFAAGVAAAMTTRWAGLEELRLQFTPSVARAALDFFPAGSGLGTFVSVYQMYEPPGLMFGAFLNHAHNDYMELWLETGLLGIAVLAAFLAWFATLFWRIWFRSEGGEFMRAASAAAALLLIHSLVDYPLRTAALAGLFAFLLAGLSPPAGSVARYFEAGLKPGRRDEEPSAPRSRTRTAP